MALPIQLISTDFDGTLFAEFESPPIPPTLTKMIGAMQSQGATWVINTGRDLSSLLETLGRAHIPIHPQFLVLVEREIYVREGHVYHPLESWNRECDRINQELFDSVRPGLPALIAWINERFDTTLYEDAYSPFCMIAGNNGDADKIMERLEDFAASISNLTVVRNDIYVRFSHGDFNKGTALDEVARQVKLDASVTFAAGDHWNDLPMLRRQHARFITAPANAVPEVKEAVQREGGYLSNQPFGHGVARALEYFMEEQGAAGLLHR